MLWLLWGSKLRFKRSKCTSCLLVQKNGPHQHNHGRDSSRTQQKLYTVLYTSFIFHRSFITQLFCSSVRFSSLKKICRIIVHASCCLLKKYNSICAGYLLESGRNHQFFAFIVLFTFGSINEWTITPQKNILHTCTLVLLYTRGHWALLVSVWATISWFLPWPSNCGWIRA